MIERFLDFLSGLIFSIKYKLGYAREGIDFFPVSSEPVQVHYWDSAELCFRVVSFDSPICVILR